MRKHFPFAVAIALVIVCVALIITPAFGSSRVLDDSRKVRLDRDDVYYDIQNDAGDGGNFMLQFHVPYVEKVKGVTVHKLVYCLVYKDHTTDGSMGGMSCDWAHATVSR